VRLEGLSTLKKFIHFIGSRTPDLLACCTIPTTTVPRVSFLRRLPYQRSEDSKPFESRKINFSTFFNTRTLKTEATVSLETFTQYGVTRWSTVILHTYILHCNYLHWVAILQRPTRLAGEWIPCLLWIPVFIALFTTACYWSWARRIMSQSLHPTFLTKNLIPFFQPRLAFRYKPPSNAAGFLAWEVVALKHILSAFHSSRCRWNPSCPASPEHVVSKIFVGTSHVATLSRHYLVFHTKNVFITTFFQERGNCVLGSMPLVCLVQLCTSCILRSIPILCSVQPCGSCMLRSIRFSAQFNHVVAAYWVASDSLLSSTMW
jgi:hypothetical protein